MNWTTLVLGYEFDLLKRTSSYCKSYLFITWSTLVVLYVLDSLKITSS